jgi:FtsH-binding integral membrane protein
LRDFSLRYAIIKADQKTTGGIIMKKNKRTFWWPLLGVVISFIAAVLCNIGATADPAGEHPVLNMIMTLVFIAAWIYFFVCFKSNSKAAYIVSIVYWGYAFAYSVCCLLSFTDFGISLMEGIVLSGTPLILLDMALPAPLMGLPVVLGGGGLAVIFIISAVFLALSIYRLCKQASSRKAEE